MHSLGVIHRDLNPTNLFLAGMDQIKLFDFNVSKLVDK